MLTAADNRRGLPLPLIIRTKLIKAYPWYAPLMMRLEMIENNAIPTLMVDGVHVWYNKEFLSGLSPETQQSAVMHEVFHAALGHCDPSRCKKMPDDGLRIIAGDYIVNDLLIVEGFKLESDWWHDPKYRNWTIEQVYRDIQNCPKHKAAAQGQFIDVLPYPGEGKPEAAEKITAEWRRAAVQASQIKQARSRDRGNTPGGFEERINLALAPVTDYRSLLAAFLAQIATDDTSWSRPNRRMLPHGLYLPGVVSEGLRYGMFAADCSGSVSSRMLSTFASQVGAILAAYSIARLDVFFVDCAIQEEYTHIQADDISRLETVRGRGGTDFECIFERLKKESEQPDFMLFFTDLECSMPPSAKDLPYPVFWFVPESCLRTTRCNFKPEYGTLISVDMEGW